MRNSAETGLLQSSILVNYCIVFFPPDPPSQPRLTATASRVDVGTPVSMRCELNSTQQPDIGNPAVDMYVLENPTLVLENTTRGTWFTQFNSVNDSGVYTCVASNLPLIGRDYSETSEELVMTVMGKSKEPAISHF